MPDLKAATYRVLRSGLTASARGVSAKKLMIRKGTPPRVLPGAAGSNTHTSARPMPAVVSLGSPAPGTFLSDGSMRCCPRCAVVTKARAGEPANTMSRGSSPTSKVRVTRGVPSSDTTLTLSDRWLTTQTSLSLRRATATGSRPTGTRACSSRPLLVMRNTSSVLLGVLTANRRVPSADMARWAHMARVKRHKGRRGGLGAHAERQRQGRQLQGAAQGLQGRADTGSTGLGAVHEMCLLTQGPPMGEL